MLIFLQNMVCCQVSYPEAVLINYKPQILICRFILNLRQIDSCLVGSNTDDPSLGTIAFQISSRVVANTGEPLVSGDAANEVAAGDDTVTGGEEGIPSSGDEVVFY